MPSPRLAELIKLSGLIERALALLEKETDV